MGISRWQMTCALAVLAFMSAADAQTARPAPDSIDAHLAAGKNAAGGTISGIFQVHDPMPPNRVSRRPS